MQRARTEPMPLYRRIQWVYSALVLAFLILPILPWPTSLAAGGAQQPVHRSQRDRGGDDPRHGGGAGPEPRRSTLPQIDHGLLSPMIVPIIITLASLYFFFSSIGLSARRSLPSPPS